MKRASYREAISVIALNDEAQELDTAVVQGLASVMVVAAIFDVPTEKVAADVVRYRKNHDE